MIIPTHTSVRGVIFASIIIFVIGVLVIVNNSKDKSEYEKATGTIDYFDKEFQNLPTRHKGDYHFLKLDTYQYLFEIYEPNSEPTKEKIDNLKVGDTIDVYYYETDNTREEGLNRFAQFIYKDNHPYFIRSGFQEQLGYVIIGLSLLMNLIAFMFWKMGKLNW